MEYVKKHLNGLQYVRCYGKTVHTDRAGPRDYDAMRSFRLSSTFLEPYAKQKAPFGYNGLGEVVYRRTYSREKGDRNEDWHETVERVVNGTYNMQKSWIQKHRLEWNPWKAQKSSQEMYRRIYQMKFLPPGRGLWAMGSPITEEKGLYAALNNCAFVSTESLKDDPSKPFCFLMDLSMLGVGVGFDTKGAGFEVPGPSNRTDPDTVVIGDSREGWVESLRILLNSYFLGKNAVNFDYSEIRPQGTRIKGFGGIASGHHCLEELHNTLKVILDGYEGKALTVTSIVDIMNLIGKCVVSGNIRRSAEIAFGEHDSEEFMDLKNYNVNPHRSDFGWASNNSIYAEIGMDYHNVAQRIQNNGEPGFAWLENMRNYSRMNGKKDKKDWRASGGNPCLEQTLESYEMCCLVETFPHRHETLEDFLETLKYAYLYAKTVSLGLTHWPESNRVMLRNRRIGCSMSGIAQFIDQRGIEELRKWCQAGYDAIQEYDRCFSDWLAIPNSIKTTSVKPSGTVSLLAGATPGLHYPESRFYIRRLRMDANSPLLKELEASGYKIETAIEDSRTKVVEFPVEVASSRTVNELSLWEQLSLAAFMQEHWADNQVSCTVTFDPETEGAEIAPALDYFQYRLKGISFLPRQKEGAFPQMPYESITEEQYLEMKSQLKSLHISDSKFEEAIGPEKFCDSSSCLI